MVSTSSTGGPPTIPAGVDSVPQRIRVDNILGAPFIGDLVTAVLYGMACLQTYVVYKQKKDRKWIRVLIIVLWLLSTLHLVAVTGVMYYWLITNYANPQALATQDLWAATTYYVVTAIIEFAIRGVFTFRVWKLSKRSWLLTSTIVVPSLVDLAGSFAFAFKNLSLTTFPDISSISWLFYMAFGSSMVADVITAISLCILLKKRSTGFRRTDSFIKFMMLYSVNTGALSSICSLMVLVMYAASNKFVYALFYYILPGVMFNSLLATLDASQRLWNRSRSGTEDGGHGAVISIPMSVIQSPPRTVVELERRRSTEQGAKDRHRAHGTISVSVALDEQLENKQKSYYESDSGTDCHRSESQV